MTPTHRRASLAWSLLALLILASVPLWGQSTVSITKIPAGLTAASVQTAALSNCATTQVLYDLAGVIDCDSGLTWASSLLSVVGIVDVSRGSSTSTTPLLNLTETYTGTTSSNRIKTIITADPTATLSGFVQGQWHQLNTGTAQRVAGLIGLGYDVTYNGVGNGANNADALHGNVFLNPASGNSNQAIGVAGYVELDAGNLNAAMSFYSSGVDVEGVGNVAAAYSFYAQTIFPNSGSITLAHQFYGQAIGNKATNAYSFWSDEQGVFRIKADNTFNSVYQAIPALYNPQFTKYTAGAANYERIILGQWNSNVAEVGNEAGGTGTLRDVRFIGQDIKPNPTGFFFLHEAVKTAAPAGTDCDAAGETNRVAFDSTNDELYVCSGASGWRKIATAAP